MQYLSQRLARKSAPERGRSPVLGGLPASQRERILDAAEHLIGTNGCAGTSIEAIVKTAGVSSATFYEFFAGKEECFVAAFERAVESAADEIEAATPGLSWPERISTGLRTVLAAVAAEPERARLVLVEAQTGGPQLSAHFEAALDRVAARLRGGRSLETTPADLPATHEEATAGALAWLVRERLERGGGDGVDALYPQLVDIALAPYLGDG